MPLIAANKQNRQWIKHRIFWNAKIKFVQGVISLIFVQSNTLDIRMSAVTIQSKTRPWRFAVLYVHKGWWQQAKQHGAAEQNVSLTTVDDTEIHKHDSFPRTADDKMLYNYTPQSHQGLSEVDDKEIYNHAITSTGPCTASRTLRLTISLAHIAACTDRTGE